MRFTAALRWGLYDRLLAFGSFVLGLALVVGGLWFGTAGWFLGLLGGDAGAPPTGTGLAIAAGGILAGLFVWQLGSAAARHRTMVTATKHELAEGVGAASTADGEVEAQLAQLESDVEDVRRLMSRIEQSMRAGEFEADGLDQRGSAGTASAGATSSSGTAGAGLEVEFGDEPADADTVGTSEAATSGTEHASADDTAVGDGGVTEASADEEASDDERDSAGDADDADAFQWAEEDADDEYYRNS